MNVTEDEFAEIVRDNEDRLRHLSRVYANRKGDEKDLFQEMLIQIWKSLPSFEGDAKLSTWIYRLAVNTAISFVRKKQTRKEYGTKYRKDQQENNTHYIDPSSQESTQLHELYEAISELNASEKAIITMYLEDFSYLEIAFVTDISENYVGVKLHRIKKKLSKKIG
ncbi:MAG: sigma-70 family RNA polymerase sigma factor [Balneolaceae bacterium]|nr:sigma-70 family RNA polymerase sigma factor [Balneolaceae bacterium]